MSIPNLKHLVANLGGNVPLRTVLIIPFVLQIAVTVGLVGYLSFRNGQQAVNDIASQVRTEIGDRTLEHIRDYLRTPHQLNLTNVNAIRLSQLDIKQPKTLERHFLQQIQVFDSLSRIVFSNSEGGLISVGNDDRGLSVALTKNFTKGTLQVYGVDRQGNRQKSLVNKPNYDARTRPFYQAALATGRPTWTPIYIYVPASRGLAIAASYPLYDKMGKLQGVLSSDFSLLAISQFLQHLKIGKSGKAFIIERSGLLVASSTTELPFKSTTDSQEKKRLKASESRERLIRFTLKHLSTQFRSLTNINTSKQLNFEIEGERQFAQVTPFKDNFGLDWLIVVVVPESDFMEQINDNTRTTILLCLLAFATATVVGIYTSGWVTQPILRLNAAATALAQGKLEQKVELNRTDELGNLARTFNQMAAKLQELFGRLEKNNHELEQRVRERTEQLQLCLEAAHMVTWDWNIQTNAIVYSDELGSVFGLPKGSTHTNYEAFLDAVHPYDRSSVQEAMTEALEAGTCYAIEFRVVWPDGTLQWVGNKGQVLRNATGEPLRMIGVAMNISDRKLAEEALRESVRREQAIARAIHRIRQTLDIQTIFSATTRELRQLIDCDRVLIYRFNPDWSGEFVSESVGGEWNSLLQEQANLPNLAQRTVDNERCSGASFDSVLGSSFLVQDTYLQETQGGVYTHDANYRAVQDIYQAGFNDCYINLLERFQARAYIIVPIFCGSQLWGLLATYQNSSSRQWKSVEINVVVEIGNQLDIALQQAELLAQIQKQSEALQQSTQREREKAQELKLTLDKLRLTQVQLIQTEKMSSLGQMVAGIAHEINNPVSFIYGNLTYASGYFQNLLDLLEIYQRTYPNPTPEIQQQTEEIDLKFLVEDWHKLMASMEVGAERIRQIVCSLRNFSRLDEQELKPVDLHEGIENTLLILQNRLRAAGKASAIEVIKDYAQLPLVTCYASQMNQVFMNLLNNAIDALETQPHPRMITIRTEVISKVIPSNGEPANYPNVVNASRSLTSLSSQLEEPKTQNSGSVIIRIADNGSGISEEVQQKIFDPFFTTKPVGSGTGLGLSISHQIVVEKHGGQLHCISTLGQGTEFIVEIPLAVPNPPYYDLK